VELRMTDITSPVDEWIFRREYMLFSSETIRIRVHMFEISKDVTITFKRNY
jgi:hypothetical protein